MSNFLDKVKEVSKDYGNMLIGMGLTAMAASLAFTAQGIFSRFDQVKGVVEDVNTGVAQVQVVQGELRRDLTVLREQFPSLGAEFGDAAGIAAESLERRLQCDETNAQDCQGGVRGRVLEGIDNLRNRNK